MGKPFRDLLRRTLFIKKGNLISLDSPYATIRHLLSGQTVNGILDAGASDGRISKRLIRLFPEAIAYLFEPNPAYAPALKALSQQDRRYQPFTCAVSDREGQLTYYETESLGCCSLFQPLHEQAKRVSTVPAITIDAWSHSHGQPSIELMKFDIQGAELSALEGGRQVLDRSVLLVYCEVWFNRVYEGGAIFSEIDLLLRSHGFELHNFYSPKSDDRDALRWANAIYWHRGKLDHHHPTSGLDARGSIPFTDA